MKIRIVGKRALNAVRQLEYTTILHEYFYEALEIKGMLKREIERYRNDVVKYLKEKSIPLEKVEDKIDGIVEEFVIELCTLKYIEGELAKKRKEYFEKVALRKYKGIPLVEAKNFGIYFCL